VSLRLALLVILVLAGCGSGASQPKPSTAAASRVDKCVARLLRRVDDKDLSKAAATQRYAETTYCAPFEKEGWIYDDGALSIDAHLYLVRGGSCEEATGGEPLRTVPCSEDTGPLLDCGILHHVRRSEVRKYVEELRQSRKVVHCDDGTPLDQLGA